MTTVTFPDGTTVQATGRVPGRGELEEPDFGLYLDEDGHDQGRPWSHAVLEWPDFGVPEDPTEAYAAIQAAFVRARRGERVEVGCLGGTGRTGTALACMAVLAGVPGDEAVQWVREHYRAGAVETPEQEQLVLEFAAGRGPAGR